MVFEKRAAFPLQRCLNRAGEHPEHRRQEHFQARLVIHNVDRGCNGLPHRGDVQIQLVAGPTAVNLRTARNMLLQLVNVVSDPPASLVLAEAVGDVDFDGLSHRCDVARRSALFKFTHRSMIQLMKLFALPVLLLAGAAASQPAQVPLPVPQAVPMGSVWDPVGPYITAGQDEPGYRSWYLAAPWRAAQVKAFNNYLAENQVSGILPTWTLLRTATSWQECGGQPFEVPPAEDWPHLVQTLRYVRDEVIPVVGPVEAVSVYRNPQLNRCAGGAPESAHKQDSAIDMVPLRPIDRVSLMRRLCGIHTEHGAAYNAGLGFYAYLRFHVDSTKYRRWNMDPAVAEECPALIHPEDIASVGQPLPGSTATAAPAAGTAPTATLMPRVPIPSQTVSPASSAPSAAAAPTQPAGRPR